MKNFCAVSGRFLTVLGTVFLLCSHYVRAAYREPDLSKPVFDITKCGLTPEERSRIATNLAVYVKNMPETALNRQEFAAKALGIALMLDPENRTATIANGQLAHGQKLTEASPATDPALVAGELEMKAKELKQKGGADNVAAAGYLLELAFGINPTNDDVMYDMELLKRSGTKVNWAFAEQPAASPAPVTAPQTASIPSPSTVAPGTAPSPGERPAYYPPPYVGPYSTPGYAPGNGYGPRSNPMQRSMMPEPEVSTVPHFPLNTVAQAGATPAKTMLNQVSVRGILVRTLDNGREMAGAYQIIANVQPGATSECTMAQAVGKEMSVAFNEACRVFQNSYPTVEPGKQIMVSFQDKYSEKDGGSAGTAFTLLFLSIYNGMQFDPDVAVTGDITVNGKVGEVGAIPAKIRGALLDKCKVVSIPASNAGDVADMELMYPPETIWKIQVLTAATIQDAVNNTRADRPENLDKAIKMFAQVQQYLEAAGPSAYLNNAAALKMLAEVVRLAPNHLSARFMLDQAAGRAPRSFSLNTSIEEVFIAAAPVLKSNNGVYIQCDKSSYDAVLGRLGQLQFTKPWRFAPLSRRSSGQRRRGKAVPAGAGGSRRRSTRSRRACGLPSRRSNRTPPRSRCSATTTNDTLHEKRASFPGLDPCLPLGRASCLWTIFPGPETGKGRENGER